MIRFRIQITSLLNMPHRVPVPVFTMKPGSRKKMEREEQDLLLFGEILKRDEERGISLLQPESIEFEPAQDLYLLHQISLGRKDFLNAESSKHDYDWLKTPPATPLFPSIEIEASQANPVLHKDIALLHPFVPSRFKGKAEEAEAQAPKSPGAKSTSSSKSATPTARSKQSNSGGNICKRPTNNTHASSLPKSRAPPPMLGSSDKTPANLVMATCKVFSIARSSKSESGGKLRKQQPCSRSGREVEKNPKAKNENSGWRTNVGFGKFISRGSNDNDEHKNKDVKNTETNHLNSRQAKNSHPVCVLPRKDSSHLAPNKQVQNCGRHSEKFNPKAGKQRLKQSNLYVADATK